MKTWLVIVACAAACGDDAKAHDADAGTTADAYLCPVIGTAPTCGATTAPTAPVTGSATCDVLAQTGCNTNEKCAWIVDQVAPQVIGHIGCAPNGTVAVGCGCTIGAAGTTGYDDCARGATCVSGACREICDNQGGAPMCGAHGACTNYQNLFVSGGTTVAGACNTKCDPLTQCGESATPTACGATNPAMPNRGCYGISKFGCSTALPQTLVLTDRSTPAGTFLNACAPGFMPLLLSETGSTQATCSGLCAALETDNTKEHKANGKGDAGASAKLPMSAEIAQGNATCEIGKKGSEATSVCKFMWPFVLDQSTGEVPTTFVPFQDTLGICMGITHYQYDSNGDGQITTADATQPDCATLPPRSAGTTGSHDDAADFQCQKVSHSMVAGRLVPPAGDLRLVPPDDVLPLVRHELR